MTLLRAYLLRAGLVWAAIHLFVALSMGKVSSFGFTGSLLLAVVAAVVVRVDAKRRREINFLQNLGISLGAPLLLGFFCAVFLEAVLERVT